MGGEKLREPCSNSDGEDGRERERAGGEVKRNHLRTTSIRWTHRPIRTQMTIAFRRLNFFYTDN